MRHARRAGKSHFFGTDRKWPGSLTIPLPAWNPSAKWWLTMIWISLLQTCKSYSLLTYMRFRAHFIPLLVLTRNTIAKPPAKDKIIPFVNKEISWSLIPASLPLPPSSEDSQRREGTQPAANSCYGSVPHTCLAPEFPTLPTQLFPGNNRNPMGQVFN